MSPGANAGRRFTYPSGVSASAGGIFSAAGVRRVCWLHRRLDHSRRVQQSARNSVGLCVWLRIAHLAGRSPTRLGMVGCEVNLLFNLFRGEHLLVGEKALQSVTRRGKVVIHIPYANIKRVRVLDVIEQRGMKQIRVRKVSFDLRKDDGDDTIGFSTSFSPGSEKGEYCIEPIYQASPDQIGKALLKRWQEFKERSEREMDEDEDEE